MRRNLSFTARRIFDTVIAARLLGIREFSLAALVAAFLRSRIAERLAESELGAAAACLRAWRNMR